MKWLEQQFASNIAPNCPSNCAVSDSAPRHPGGFEEGASAPERCTREPVDEYERPGVESSRFGTKSGPSRDQAQVLVAAQDPRLITELMELVGRASRTKFRDQVVRPLLEAGYLEMTIPDKPRSSKQRYRTTEAGRRLLGKEPTDA